MGKLLDKRVAEIVMEQLGVDRKQVISKANFADDLGADSLDLVELIMAFEDEFSLEILDDDAEKLQTVGAVMDYLGKHVNPKSL